MKTSLLLPLLALGLALLPAQGSTAEPKAAASPGQDPSTPPGTPPAGAAAERGAARRAAAGAGAGRAAAKAVEGKALVYKRVGGQDLALYVHYPPQWKSSDRRPALVLFHGGGWTGGTPAQFNHHAAYLASRGLVTCSVQYRLVKREAGEGPLVCVQDSRSALRWVRAHAADLGVDPQRIAAGGGSAGGHLAALLGTGDGNDDPQDDPSVPARPNAVVLFNPVLALDGINPERARGRTLPASLIPMEQVSAGDAPAILFLGSDDAIIPVPVARRFETRMKEVGVRCDVHIYEGQTHGFFNYEREGGRFYRKTLAETDRFLASLGWLQGPPTLE